MATICTDLSSKSLDKVGPTWVDAFAQFGHNLTSCSMCLDTPGCHTDEAVHWRTSGCLDVHCACGLHALGDNSTPVIQEKVVTKGEVSSHMPIQQ